MNLAAEGADGAPNVNAGALLSGCLEKADASAAVLSILGVKPPSGEEDEEVEAGAENPAKAVGTDGMDGVGAPPKVNPDAGGAGGAFVAGTTADVFSFLRPSS